MATIQKRKRKDGTTAYRAIIRIKKGGKVVHSESDTFSKQQRAREWASEREEELRNNPDIVGMKSAHNVTLSHVLDELRKEREKIKPDKKTYIDDLRRIASYSITEVPIIEVNSHWVYDYAIKRRDDGVAPQTTSGDLSRLRAAFDHAYYSMKIPVTKEPFQKVSQQLRKEGLVAKSKTRDRRPSEKEIKALREYFRSMCGREWPERPWTVPMETFMDFGIYTCLRIGEVCRLRWEDLDRRRKMIIVRDRKDPEDANARDEEIPLLGQAWDIVMAQPEDGDLIFPYNSSTVSTYWQRARDDLKIKDLRFHDLRHEGITRLFELGYRIQEVALVSGHRDWKSLQRYVETKPEDLHDDYDYLVREQQRRRAARSRARKQPLND